MVNIAMQPPPPPPPPPQQQQQQQQQQHRGNTADNAPVKATLNSDTINYVTIDCGNNRDREDEMDVTRIISTMKITDETNRMNYTDMVKRKYFGQEKDSRAGILSYMSPSKDGSTRQNNNNCVSTNGNDNNNHAFTDDNQSGGHKILPSRPLIEGSSTTASDKNSLLSPGIRIDRPPSEIGSPSDILGMTPPLTLFSKNVRAPSLTLNYNNNYDNNLDSDNESVGNLSSLGSAASSRGSISTAAFSVIQQPVLYSAIGSLEHANNNSYSKLNKRFLAPSKEFCKPGGLTQSILIPPIRTHHQPPGQQPRTSSSASSNLLPAILSCSDLHLEQYDECDTNRSTTTTTKRSQRNENEAIEISNKNKKGKKIDRSIPSDIPVEIPSRGDPSNRDRGTVKNFDTTAKAKKDRKKKKKKVSYDPDNVKIRKGKKKSRKGSGRPVEIFRPSSDAYTPRIERKDIKYKTAEARAPVHHMSSHMGTLQRPNFRDALRRVAMIIRQHIVKIESRFEQQGEDSSDNRSPRMIQIKANTNDGLFHASMRDIFHEDCYRTPTYKCNIARIPMARPGMVYGLRKIRVVYMIPTETDIYDFGHQLFNSVQLSSECSIVCLIYVERLMEVAKVPLLACTWRPIFMCGLLLASKVWQDLSSWNIEFSSVYPQFSLESINKLELNFLRNVRWDLYISSRYVLINFL